MANSPMTQSIRRGGPMDFSYSSEEEKFRQEVRSWLETNITDDIRGGREEDLSPPERWGRQKAGDKKEYRGGWVGLLGAKEKRRPGGSGIEPVPFDEKTP